MGSHTGFANLGTKNDYIAITVYNILTGATCYLNSAMQVLRSCQLDWEQAQGSIGKAIYTFFLQKSSINSYSNKNPEKVFQNLRVHEQDNLKVFRCFSMHLKGC